MLWPLPQVRFQWKSEEVSKVVYECFLRGTIEALPINRFDGSLGFFVYLLEETLHEQVFLILANRRHGLIAFHLRERTTGRPSQVILARQPLHRPKDYSPDQPLTLCRIRRRRSTHPQQPVPLHLAVHLYALWKTGPFEGVDLAGASWLCRAVRDTAAKLAWRIGSPVVAAYRNPREHIIALLSLDADNRWDKVGFIPEFRLREKIPFHLPVLTLGEDAALREGFPNLG